MANGKPGDHPLTDLLYYGTRLFPDDICDLILEINAIDPYAFQQDYSIGAVDWEAYRAKYGDWDTWYLESRLDDARAFLLEKLSLANTIVNRRDSAADKVSDAILKAFPEWGLEDTAYKGRKRFTTYSASWPEASLSATRIHWDLFLRIVEGAPDFLALVVETHPRPRVLLGVEVLAEFAPGDAGATVRFLKAQSNLASRG